jgi:hypothetical protein
MIALKLLKIFDININWEKKEESIFKKESIFVWKKLI